MVSEKHLAKFSPEFSGELLKIFIKHCERLYGLQFIIYNVHLLLHLYTNVERYGILDNFSAFPLIFLGKLKTLVKSTVNYLKEVYNCIFGKSLHSHSLLENDVNFKFKVEHNAGPLVANMNHNLQQSKKVYLKNIILTSVLYSAENSYCMFQNV